MNKPQRHSSIGQRDSLRGGFRRSSSLTNARNTPLLRTTSRPPLSAVKTNQRESYIGTSNQHAVKDPRPLSDKSHMKRCVLEILEILSSLNYPTTLTPKMFNPPSSKEYQRVFEFLTFEVMGNFRILGKADEEMLKALKDLGYPYNISRSTLGNVGAMSCWPQALGALMWIADLARYSQGLDDAIEETLCLSSRKTLKHEFNSRCYNEFMRGNDGPFEELESQLKQGVDELDAEALKSLDKKKVEHAKLSAEYDSKIKEKEACVHLVDEIESKRSNVQKMRQYLSQCADYITIMKNTEKEVEDAIKAKEEEIRLSSETLMQLKSQVSEQEMSPADMEQLIHKKQQLRESIQAATSRLEQLKTTKWSSDVQLGKLTLKADELVATCNNELKIVLNSLSTIKEHLPSDITEKLQTSDFTLAFGHRGLENEAILANRIQPFLSALNSKMLEAVSNLESEYYNIRKRVKQDNEIIADLKKEQEQLTDQYQKLQKESELQKEDLSHAEKVNIAKISKAETAVEQLKSAQSESIEDMETKVNETKERGKIAMEKHGRIESDKKNNLQKLASIVERFQVTLHERASFMHESFNQIEAEALQRLREEES